MARKTFALNTLPHVADIGGVELELQPEVMGDEFLDAYEELQEKYKAAGLDGADTAGLSAEQLRETTTALREFLASLMLPESAEEFRTMRLPARVLGDLLEWTMEVYGGGRPTGSSNGSAPASPKAGRSGTGASRSKASTRTAGRSRAS